MKKIFIPLFLALFHFNSFAQLTIGPKINLGAGAFHSSNFQKNLDVMNNNDPDIVSWDAKSKLGGNFGIGGFVQYALNDHLALLGEISYNSFSSRYDLKYSENTISSNNKTIDISSQAKFKSSFLSIPILVKYSFKGKTGLYATGGISLNFLSSPKITSSETFTQTDYSKKPPEAKVTNFGAAATMDGFTNTSMNLVLGAGYSFLVGGKSLSIDIRYNYSLAKSTLYTSDGSFDSSSRITLNNELFTKNGVQDANKIVPQYPLNDFKMGFVQLSVAYSLSGK